MENNTKLAPLFPRFNVAVLHIAGLVCPRGYDVRPDHEPAMFGRHGLETAPTSLQGQQAWFKAHGRPCVDSRNSGLTIYGDPEVNFAFRAWHEMTHLRLQAAFSPDGEERVARGQIADVAKLYGARESELFAAIIWCEVMTQAQYYRQTGQYVDNQRMFALQRLSPQVVRALSPRAVHPRVFELQGSAPVAA